MKTASPEKGDSPCAIGVFLFVLLAITVGMFVHRAYARDIGQWEKSDPKIRDWYEHLMRPDLPTAICCREADAYWADEVHVRNGKTYATVTDDRDDKPLGRPHIENGTEFEVPKEKLKWDSSNPTGHNILFVSLSGFTWCFVLTSGA